MRRSIVKLRAHLRENGWRKTVRDMPMLMRRRLDAPDPQPQTTQEPADPASVKLSLSDPSLPHLGTATDPELMREVFQRHLLDGKDSRVLECKVDSAVHLRNRRCMLYYTLRLGEDGRERERDQQITATMYAKEQDRQFSEDLEEMSRYTDRLNPYSSGITAPFFHVPELDMLAQVFPHDYRLPALSILMAGPPPELEPLLLAQFGPGDWHAEAWNAEPVRYWINSRATLRLTMRARDYASGRTEERHYYAKVYREEQRAEQTYRVLTQLWDKAGTGDETFTVGRPIAYLSGLRTIVQEEVSGSFLDEMLRREEDPSWMMRKVARALANVHLSDVVPPRRHRLQYEVARLSEARKDLLSVYPHLEPDIEEIFGTVVAGLRKVRLVPTHGDLRSTHLRLEGDRFALLDLDSFVGADPVWDVAHLSYTLAREVAPRFLLGSDRGQGPRARAIVQPFVEEYFIHVPKAWRARLPFCYAGIVFKKAALLVRRGVPSRPQGVEALLEEAKHSLTGRVW